MALTGQLKDAAMTPQGSRCFVQQELIGEEILSFLHMLLLLSLK